MSSELAAEKVVEKNASKERKHREHVERMLAVFINLSSDL